MSIIYVLIPIVIIFVIIGIAMFFWAVRSKQFDDLDKEGFSILFNEKPTSSAPPADPSNPPSREP